MTKLSVTMWYTFFGIFDDTSLWILPKMHDPSLCDTPDELIMALTFYNWKGIENSYYFLYFFWMFLYISIKAHSCQVPLFYLLHHICKDIIKRFFCDPNNLFLWHKLIGRLQTNMCTFYRVLLAMHEQYYVIPTTYTIQTV